MLTVILTLYLLVAVAVLKIKFLLICIVRQTAGRQGTQSMWLMVREHCRWQRNLQFS